MKDAYQVLHQKEAELAQVRREIASLRIVAPLLTADSHAENPQRGEKTSEDDTGETRAESEATGTDGFSTFAAVSKPKIWNVLKRGKQD